MFKNMILDIDYETLDAYRCYQCRSNRLVLCPTTCLRDRSVALPGGLTYFRVADVCSKSHLSDIMGIVMNLSSFTKTFLPCY